MLEGITNSGALPALDASIRFAAERQKLIAHNIANISTPDFVQKDVSPRSFQVSLRQAIQERRERAGTAAGTQGALSFGQSREIRFGPGGRLTLNPIEPATGVLGHDRNNRDVERLMQDLAENTAAYRASIDLMRSQTEVLRIAIAQRV